MVIAPLAMSALISSCSGFCALEPMAPPRAFAVQYESGPNSKVTALARCSCSNRQFESQPSRFVRLPSSHCSLPDRTPSPQTMFWQLLSQVIPLGGSHCSPGSTAPLPHRLGRQAPWRQTLPVSHAVPFGSGVLGEQVWVESSQVEPPWHGSAGAQLRVESVETHANRQLASQP